MVNGGAFVIPVLHEITPVNMNVMRIRRMFSWGVAEELVPETVLRALQALSGLQAGRTRARESKIVGPVVLAPDISPDRRRASIAVAGASLLSVAATMAGKFF